MEPFDPLSVSLFLFPSFPLIFIITTATVQKLSDTFTRLYDHRALMLHLNERSDVPYIILTFCIHLYHPSVLVIATHIHSHTISLLVHKLQLYRLGLRNGPNRKTTIKDWIGFEIRILIIHLFNWANAMPCHTLACLDDDYPAVRVRGDVCTVLCLIHSSSGVCGAQRKESAAQSAINDIIIFFKKGNNMSFEC